MITLRSAVRSAEKEYALSVLHVKVGSSCARGAEVLSGKGSIVWRKGARCGPSRTTERDARTSGGRSTSVALRQDYGTILTSAASTFPANVVLPVGMMTAAAGSDTVPVASPNVCVTAATVPLTFAIRFEAAMSE